MSSVFYVGNSIMWGTLFMSYGQYVATTNLNNTRGKCLY